LLAVAAWRHRLLLGRLCRLRQRERLHFRSRYIKSVSYDGLGSLGSGHPRSSAKATMDRNQRVTGSNADATITLRPP
jgi:hypothetical protein